MSFRRPSSLDPESRAQLFDYIRLGLPIKRACIAVGVPRRTYYTWRERGKESKERIADGNESEADAKDAEYRQFFDDSEVAQIEAEAALLEKIHRGGKGSSNAEWLLERRYPKRYSLRRQLAIEEQPKRKKVTFDFTRRGNSDGEADAAAAVATSDERED